MNKKKEIHFNLNNFLLSVSFVFDALKTEQTQGNPNYTKAVAFLALKIGEKFNLGAEDLSDLCSYSLIHMMGMKESKQDIEQLCTLGNQYSEKFPFLGTQQDIIKYHQEYFDGSGLFGLKEEEIPLFSQIISFSSLINSKFDLSKISISDRKELLEYVHSNEKILFSTDMTEIFCDELSSDVSFWLDFQNENELLAYIFSQLQDFGQILSFEQLLDITTLYTQIVNPHSQLIKKSKVMCEFYAFEHKDMYTFLIAGSLSQIGKLAVSDDIIHKTAALSAREYEQIKAYPYYTRKVLNNIMGFSDIASWASNLQETVDGLGYPYGLQSKDLSFKDRLMATLNIYDALTQNKMYRKSFCHEDAIQIMNDLAVQGKLDTSIVDDINNVFSNS